MIAHKKSDAENSLHAGGLMMITLKEHQRMEKKSSDHAAEAKLGVILKAAHHA